MYNYEAINHLIFQSAMCEVAIEDLFSPYLLKFYFVGDINLCLLNLYNI
ncbi:hypothetical protein SAMN06272722_101127 [Paenibacillus sp. RU5A]|nr:hypothetical protein SAMN06272722_101127 [Paenibacillus sp. RU5A]SOC63927.1 hypothetical protein SAMN05880581_1011064 [Paenibacillus sp. RU26A]SOC68566.1 hypothetical protein SAMN05880586_1011063 [Paenibacillus sp. RU5M]